MHFYASRGLNINVSINLQVQSELGCQWSAKNSQKSISLTSDIEIYRLVCSNVVKLYKLEDNFVG